MHLSQILKRNARTGEGSEELWKYSYEKLIMPNVKKGILKRINSPLIFIVGVQALQQCGIHAFPLNKYN